MSDVNQTIDKNFSPNFEMQFVFEEPLLPDKWCFHTYQPNSTPIGSE